MEKKWFYFLCLIVVLVKAEIYSQEDVPDKTTTKEKMEALSEKTEIQWKYNPFRVSKIERRLVGWQDPYANITRFWIGANLNASNIFSDPNFFIEDIMLFYTPTIATELSALGFNTERLKFRLGVGVLIDINMGTYNKNAWPRYGRNFMFSDTIQVEVYMDFIIDDTWKLRWIPIRHKCSHVSGDILGDPALHDPINSPFGDSGNETMVFEAYYNYAWFTFYGGIEIGTSGFETAAFTDIFSIYLGTDMRVPVWGEINFITGFYVAADYDRFNNMYRSVEANNGNLSGDPVVLSSYKKWYPTFNLGAGFEIYNFTLGLKYSLMRSRQIRYHTLLDHKVGAEFTILY